MRHTLLVIVGALAASALSLRLVAPAPSYDPWSWLLWGRETIGGTLSTSEGPAFKPLPVAICALLTPFGAAAPWLWVMIARAGAFAAIYLVFRFARRVAGGSVAAGLAAAAGLVLCGEFAGYTASGVITGLMLALALAGVEAWRQDRAHLAMACGMGCALLQVEAWPFVFLAGAVLWRRRPDDRPWIAACLVAIPALWLVPELIGSGDVLRSAERARIPNPGNPALAEIPGYASLRQSTGLLLWPLWLGSAWLAVTLVRRRPQRLPDAALPALAGIAWIGLVALLAQLGGFSGEPRYALPGVVLIGVSGAAGLALAGRRLVPVALLPTFLVAVIAFAALPRVDEVASLRDRQAYQWELADGLARAVHAIGGRDVVLACGQPYVGNQRGPLMAYQLDVEKHDVEPDLPPRPPGMVFRSRLTVHHRPAPKVGGRFHELLRSGPWQVYADCERQEY